MDNIRLFLWLAAISMLWFNYSAWVADRAPSTPAPQLPAAAETPDGERELLLPELPGSASPAGEAPPPGIAEAKPRETVRVRTDVLEVLIDTQGGDLVRTDLLDYPVDKHDPNHPVRLLEHTPEDRWVFQTGLRSAEEGEEPNHLAAWRAQSTSFELAPGQDELVVELEWAGGGALSARKRYTFRRGEYRVGLELELHNEGAMPWRGASYAQMLRLHRPVKRSLTSIESYSFRGPVLYDGDQFEKLDVEELAAQPISASFAGGWIAGIQHHFLAAVVPPQELPFDYRASARDEHYILTAVGPIDVVPPGGQERVPFTLFVGPKLQEQLEATAGGLELTVDYGMLTVLAQPLFTVLSWIHDLVGNWGWSIIIVTLLIKLAFYKLTETSGRSMAKMRKLTPRMKSLQERYKDDKQALSRAMMELYKREKVNPAAGCLPILVQMPFFFAFYWVLIESVEMRQAPFMLWIDDLSSRDPFFVLPLLMGAAMFLQTRLNPAPPDPLQARMMQIMPIAFSVFFAFFPSGLVLYWLTNTVVSIAQQWRINRVVAQQG